MDSNLKRRKDAEASSLSRTGSAILKGNSINVAWLPDEAGEIGFTNETRTVFLAWQHKTVMGMLSESECAAFRMGVFAHELLHQCLTNFTYTSILCKRMSQPEAAVFMKFANTLEDPAIEYFAPQIFGGKLLNALRFSIRHIYKISPGIDKSPNAFSQLINALINFGDMGLVKGIFTFPEAFEYFCKIAPLYNEGITCPDSKRRLDIAYECMQICKPLWEEAVKEEEFLQELIKELLKELKKKGLNLFDGKVKEMEDSSEAGERRKNAVKQMKKASSKNSEEGNSADGSIDSSMEDLDDLEEGEEGESGDMSADKKEDNSTNSSSTSSQPMKDLDDNSETEDDSDDSSSKSDTSDKSSSDGTITGEGSFTADEETANEIANETFEITEEMVEEIEKSIKDEERRCEKEERASTPSKKSLPSYDIDASDVCKSASCLNQKMTSRYSGASLKHLYNELKREYSYEIKHLKKTLGKIFENDVDENYRFTSGSYNIKRGSIATSARIFDKRREKGDRKDVAVMLVVDESGSMSGQNKMEEARKTSIVFAEALSELKVPYYVMGFRADSGADAVHDHYVGWDNKSADRETLAAMHAGGNNFDGYSIRYAAKLLAERPESKKIMFVISDGQPAARKYRGHQMGISDTINAIKDARKVGTVFGIGLGYSCGPDLLQMMYGKDFIFCEDPNLLNNTLCKKLEKLIVRE